MAYFKFLVILKYLWKG